MEQDYAAKQEASNFTLNETIDRNEILYIYSGLTLLTVIIAVVKSISFMIFFTVASRNLHDYIFSQIIRARMRFYNSNPSGRILNRFSKDMGNIDEYIPSVLIDVIEVHKLYILLLVRRVTNLAIYRLGYYLVVPWCLHLLWNSSSLYQLLV